MNKKLIFVFIFLMLLSVNVFAYIPKAQMKIFAVSNSNVGMDANLLIEIKPGTGKIYSNVNSQVGSLTQESERNAVNAAERVVLETKGKYDYFFEIQSQASSIDGPSAGAAMSLLLVSMLSDKDLSGKVSITGTITEDGYVGEVGGIGAKSRKASEVGIKLFMIPLGTRRQAITTDSGESQIVDLPEYALDKWDMKIVEVETIEDIEKFVEMDIDEIDINATKEASQEEYIPSEIEYSDALLPMRALVNKYLVDANDVLKRTEGSISDSKIKDSSIVQSLLSLVDYSKESIKRAENYSKGNYLYTAANEAFLAKIYLIAIEEVVNNPSILTEGSTVYNLRLKDIEDRITQTEEKLKSCSLNKLEWCVSSKQRLVWATNKIKEIKSSSNSGSQLDKIMDYSYALGWIEISNDFLNAGLESDTPAFVETTDFRLLAQQYIVDVENEIVLVSESIASDDDIKRRLNAAKTDYEKGWYVTALYDAASAKAVLSSRKETEQENFDENIFISKYNSMSFLNTEQNRESKTNIWSKMYYDHATYYYKSYQYYKNKNTTKAQGYIKTANSIINLSKELYDIETKVLDYYNKGNIVVEIVDSNKKSNSETNTSTKKINESQNVYVYSNNSKETKIFFVIAIGLFLMIIAIVVDNEIRRNSRHQKIQALLLELEKKLIDGHISKFTYEDMKKSYLKELKEIEERNQNPRLKRYQEEKQKVEEEKIQKEKEETKKPKPAKKPVAKKKK
jgi:uncharacterized protein